LPCTLSTLEEGNKPEHHGAVIFPFKVNRLMRRGGCRALWRKSHPYSCFGTKISRDNFALGFWSYPSHGIPASKIKSIEKTIHFLNKRHFNCNVKNPLVEGSIRLLRETVEKYKG
jgi:hypothetical protein